MPDTAKTLNSPATLLTELAEWARHWADIQATDESGSARKEAAQEVLLMLQRAGAQLPAPASSAPDEALRFETYQSRTRHWRLLCFGEQVLTNQAEGCHRFLEEALELVQALGCTHRDAIALVDYVYGREVGEPSEEVGGVMLSLAGLCDTAGLSFIAYGEARLAYAWTIIERVRAKQKTKPALSGSSPR